MHPMPGAAPARQKANQLFDVTNRDLNERARRAVRSASTVAEAAESANLYEEMDEAIENEVRLVLAALPEAIDQALLGAVRSGLERGITVAVDWEEGSPVALRIAEVDGDDPRLDIVVITPHGDEYTGARR
jgi:hypothetical protein